jgi:cytoskeletal protein CcmA (bactofilin family)
MFKKGEEKGGIKAFLSSDVMFEGKFVFKGTVNLDCKLVGEVFSEDGMLIVGEDGEIQGTVEVKHLLLKGKIEGDIKVEKLEVFSSGKIIGKVITNSIFMQAGAIFEGECSMLKTNVEHNEVTSPKVVKKIN